MPLTAHDILMDADLFKGAYPGWPGVDPLAGPFPTSRQLTDYSDMPGYAIPAGSPPAPDPGASPAHLEPVTTRENARRRVRALRAQGKRPGARTRSVA